MSNRLDQEREQRLQPKRMLHSKKAICDLGFAVFNETKTSFQFNFKGSVITFFPYSGWAYGKSIQDGRGLEKLLNQLKTK